MLMPFVEFLKDIDLDLDFYFRFSWLYVFVTSRFLIIHYFNSCVNKAVPWDVISSDSKAIFIFKQTTFKLINCSMSIFNEMFRFDILMVFYLRFGPRFPSMTKAFDKEYQNLAHEISQELGYGDFTRNGIYCMFSGPTYETPIELKLVELVRT